tara:strand:+ start:84 stop:656 length:573 start_codon:yes stop_codon:yes gene_type:complete
MSSRLTIFIFLIFFGILFFINYKFNNILVRTYNNAKKLPKIVITVISIIAIISPALLKNNNLLKRFDTFLPNNISDVISPVGDHIQKFKQNEVLPEKIIREPTIKRGRKKKSEGTTTKSKRKVSEQSKKYVAANQEWRCKKCTKLLGASFEVDHINPLYKGGDNSLSNLQALCRNCHGDKTIYDRIKEQF